MLQIFEVACVGTTSPPCTQAASEHTKLGLTKITENMFLFEPGGASLFYLCRLQLSLHVNTNQTYKAKKTVCITPKSLLFSIFFFALSVMVGRVNNLNNNI